MTRVRVEPSSCDRDRRKREAFTFSASLFSPISFTLTVFCFQNVVAEDSGTYFCEANTGIRGQTPRCEPVMLPAIGMFNHNKLRYCVTYNSRAQKELKVRKFYFLIKKWSKNFCFWWVLCFLIKIRSFVILAVSYAEAYLTSLWGQSRRHFARAAQLLSKKCCSGCKLLATLCQIWTARDLNLELKFLL